MWLINVETMQLEEFWGTAAPKYAILSHKWVDGEEVSFQDMARGTVESKPGYQKIQKMCHLAKDINLGYAWVDTCCIDKNSSAELSESINSMFRWYQESAICCVYLHDLEKAEQVNIDISQCIWFTRGWTLQELIAPDKVFFYNASWERIGSRMSLKTEISNITGIDERVLMRLTDEPLELSQFSVAQRMSWASARHTTKPEDIAYCLLGLFEVNMPLLYGEGTDSFLRLQEAILEKSQDLSVLAWKPVDNVQTCRGAFARSPAEFAWCRTIFPLSDIKEADDFALTGNGLQITTRLLEHHQHGTKKRASELPYSQLVLQLNCASWEGGLVGLLLKKVGERAYVRDVTSDGGIRLDNTLDTEISKNCLIQQRINIPRNVSNLESLRYNRLRVFGTYFHIADDLKVIQAIPPERWDPCMNAFTSTMACAIVALVLRPKKAEDSTEDFVVIITGTGMPFTVLSQSIEEADFFWKNIYILLRRHPKASYILEHASSLHEGDIQQNLKHRALEMTPFNPNQRNSAAFILPGHWGNVPLTGSVQHPFGEIYLARGQRDIPELNLGEEVRVDCVAISLPGTDQASDGNEVEETGGLQSPNSLPDLCEFSLEDKWRRLWEAAPVHLNLEDLEKHPSDLIG